MNAGAGFDAEAPCGVGGVGGVVDVQWGPCETTMYDYARQLPENAGRLICRPVRMLTSLLRGVHQNIPGIVESIAGYGTTIDVIDLS